MIDFYWLEKIYRWGGRGRDSPQINHSHMGGRAIYWLDSTSSYSTKSSQGIIITCSCGRVLTWCIYRSSVVSARPPRVHSTGCGSLERREDSKSWSPSCPGRWGRRCVKAGDCSCSLAGRCPVSRPHRTPRACSSSAPGQTRRPQSAGAPPGSPGQTWPPPHHWAHTAVSSLLAASSGPSTTWSSPDWSGRWSLRTVSGQ